MSVCMSLCLSPDFKDGMVHLYVSKYKLGYVMCGSTAFKVQKDFKCGSTTRNVA